MIRPRAAALAALAATILLGACHKDRDASGPPKSPPVNAIQQTPPGKVVEGGGVPVPNVASAFVPAATIANLYEIQAGQIAAQKSQSPQVRALAQMMVQDHQALAQQMQQALATAGAGVTPPTALDNLHQAMVQDLQNAPAGVFDLIYLHQQLAAHQEALTLMQAYAAGGDNAALKVLASKAVPVIRKHLHEVRRVGGGQLAGTTPG